MPELVAPRIRWSWPRAQRGDSNVFLRLLCLINRAWILDAQWTRHRRIPAHISARIRCQKLGHRQDTGTYRKMP